MSIELVAAGRLAAPRLYAPWRRVLACRPPPPEVDVAAAVDHFDGVAGRRQFERWRSARPRRRPTAADGFWLDPIVRSIRWRAHVIDVRDRARRAARRQGLLEPPPRPEHATDAQYGLACLAAAERGGWSAPQGVADDYHRQVDYGRRTRARWEALERAVDVDCPYVQGPVPCARAVFRPRDQYHVFWSLVADTRPVVISAATGRLIDGLRRLDAHRAAGDRSPGMPLELRLYDSPAAELEDVVRLNASNPDLSADVRAQIAEALRPAYRREAARNSGRSRYHVARHSSDIGAGRPGARYEKPPPAPPRRVNDRLADLAGMRRSSYAAHRRPMPPDAWAALDRALAADMPTNAAAGFWSDVEAEAAGAGAPVEAPAAAARA